MKALFMSLDQLVGLAKCIMDGAGEKPQSYNLYHCICFVQLFCCWISNLTSLYCLSSQAIKTSLFL